jgi:hypothetical protein
MRITGAERASLAADLRRRYDAGQDSPQLAAEFGLTGKLTLTLLREAGTLIRPRGPKAKPRPTCVIVDEDGECPNPVFVISRGMCRKHYARWRKHGDPLMVLPGPVKFYGEERAELAAQLWDEYRKYEAGKGLTSLAEGAGISAPTVRKLIQEAGGTTRTTGKHRTYDDATEAFVLAEHGKGRSVPAIAADLGRSVTFVRKLLLRNGVSLDGQAGPSFRGLNAFTDENRILAAATGQRNPFTCVAPGGCSNLAIPKDGYLCSMHKRRLDLYGRLEREPCIRCGSELDTLGFSYLCRKCRRGWRYCTYPDHQGERIVPLSAMRNRRVSWCIECQNLESRKRAGSRKCARCGGWVIIGDSRRTVCADCWEGVEGCAQRSGECSQPASRLINGLCMSHYHRSRRAAATTPGPYHRLTEGELAEVSARYAVGGITQAQLAHEYGVHRSTITRPSGACASAAAGTGRIARGR